MLVLSRKPNQRVMIGEGISVTVLEVQGNRVKLGFECPREVPVLRGELHAFEAAAPTTAAREFWVPCAASA